MNGIRMNNSKQGHPISEKKKSSPALAHMWLKMCTRVNTNIVHVGLGEQGGEQEWVI